ncbi:MAG TPA: histidine kinase [Puia sp.]|uniref:sensor histidine kinase n=1 Tax=Puia sp. TaxID=2045100 RepID=UPI002C8A2C19|nr:histidine kinase [Puia sp.]HVU96752.1 histidine kinase [Puia sp.]
MQFNRYSRIEPMIFIWFMLPYTILVNLLLFGYCSVSSTGNFFIRLGISLFYFAAIYSVFGTAAMLIKKRFPGDHELFRRVGILLPLFCVMNLLTVQGVYWLYEKWPIGDCQVQRSMEWWVTGYGCLASAILTFVNEAGLGWEKWKTAMAETDRLHNAYQKSRLMSLKRQLHPHFLFNCFNTLSSLIQENEKEAGKFLDELTRVYRYLLKGADEQLVSLGEELKFIDAYLYLVKTRFGPALQVELKIDKSEENKAIAPMSLLIVLENIIYRNAFSKSRPLRIEIQTRIDGSLLIQNSLQPKPVTGDGPDQEEGLDDLVAKYRLLGCPEMVIRETAASRSIFIPLIPKSEPPL